MDDRLLSGGMRLPDTIRPETFIPAFSQMGLFGGHALDHFVAKTELIVELNVRSQSRRPIVR